MPTSRACRARPSAAGPIAMPVAYRGKAGNDARGGFLGGARSPRPRIRAGRKPERVMIADELARGRWPKGEGISVGVIPTSRACGARPSEGWDIRARMALRGKPGDNARGDFVGGARSPRPGGKAARTPRHFISTTCVDDDPVAKGRQRWSWRCAVVTGVRSPPLRETGARTRGPAASKARCIGRARCRHYARGGSASRGADCPVEKPDPNVLTQPLARFFSKKEAT
jgi:hypothetical protein